MENLVSTSTEDEDDKEKVWTQKRSHYSGGVWGGMLRWTSNDHHTTKQKLKGRQGVKESRRERFHVWNAFRGYRLSSFHKDRHLATSTKGVRAGWWQTESVSIENKSGENLQFNQGAPAEWINRYRQGGKEEEFRLQFRIYRSLYFKKLIFIRRSFYKT